MSVKRKVSIQEAIVDAMDRMDIDGNKDVDLFKYWAIRADRKIGSYYAYKRQIHVLDVVNCRAKLPCEVIAVNALIFGDCGCNCGMDFEWIYRSFGNALIGSIDARVGADIVSSGMYVASAVKWNIQNNCIVFSGNFDGQKITIDTLCYVLDDQGFPMVNEEHVEAISAFIELQNAQRSRWRKVGIKISETGIQFMQNEWRRLCAHARAESGEPSPTEWLEIRRMINDPLSGVGMALWNYNDGYYHAF